MKNLTKSRLFIPLLLLVVNANSQDCSITSSGTFMNVGETRVINATPERGGWSISYEAKVIDQFISGNHIVPTIRATTKGTGTIIIHYMVGNCLTTQYIMVGRSLVSSQCDVSVNLTGDFVVETSDGAEDHQIEITENDGGPWFYGWATSWGPSNTIPKSRFPGLQNGRDYKVRAKIKANGVWGDWRPYCYIHIDENAGARVLRGENNQSIVNMEVFPNPSGNSGFNLNLDNLDEEAESQISIHVHDMYGKEIYNEQVSHIGSNFTTNLNTNGDLAPGIYLLNVQVNGKSFTEKVQVR